MGSLKIDEELKNLQKLLRQLRCLWSFGKWRDAQVLRTLPEELRVLQPEELEQLEVFAVRALMSLAVRPLLRIEVCEKASWA